jgi:hypothetical protein
MNTVRTKHRLSGLSHARQCGDDVVFRLFVTGGLPVRSGGGMPPANKDHFAALASIAGHGSRIVGKHARLGGRLPTPLTTRRSERMASWLVMTL